MINLVKKGNILDAGTEALVNTVNTYGVMGAGIALQFKKAFPENFKLYEQASKRHEIQIGKLFVTETGSLTNPKYIINFPTKKHWRNPSKISWIKEGLNELRNFILDKEIKSIAVPPLGCGNGKLKWDDIKPLIIEFLNEIKNLEVLIFEPSDFAYSHSSKKSRTKKPNLTPTRAMVIALFNRYKILGYELSLLEAQKLTYFLERFGEPLRLKFTKGIYGPFSETLTHVLNDLDGHYLAGMKQKTAKPLDKIIINQRELEKVNNFIETSCTPEQKARLGSVYNLIEGFESPLGLELLATVDYVIKYELGEELFTDLELEDKIYSWSERKKRIMKKEYIEIAYKRLNKFTNQLYQ